MDKIFLLRKRPKNCQCGEPFIYDVESCNNSHNFIHRVYCPKRLKDGYDFQHDLYFWISDSSEKEDIYNENNKEV